MNNMSRIAEAFGFTNTQSAKNQSHTEGEIETTGTDASGQLNDCVTYSNTSDTKRKEKAFIPFITCGDPDLDTTRALILEMQAQGADLIELGIPFSDPCAEGPTIQEANIRALKTGITTDDIFDFVQSLTTCPDKTAPMQAPLVHVPLVFMTYANVVFSYGSARFMQRCKETGIAGIILPDVPFEERNEFLPDCKKYGIVLISLVAPTSKDRIERIAQGAQGFIYVVSSLGVTGERSEFSNNLADMIALIRKNTNLPCAIGFGISTPEAAQDMARLADGVIVGSAIVKMVGHYQQDAPQHVGRFVHAMKDACRLASSSLTFETKCNV